VSILDSLTPAEGRGLGTGCQGSDRNQVRVQPLRPRTGLPVPFEHVLDLLGPEEVRLFETVAKAAGLVIEPSSGLFIAVLVGNDRRQCGSAAGTLVFEYGAQQVIHKG